MGIRFCIVVLPLLPERCLSQNKSESNGGLSVFIKVEMGIAATPYSVINLLQKATSFSEIAA
jgi:hypothetical protein